MDATGGPGRAAERGLMPRRDDIESILVIGSGPIVIGQACEFDYSGTQACRVLAEEKFRVVLANSNPATIMTDPAMADRTYVEPLDPDVLTAIIERERPDALLPTLGGQTALNLTMALSERGVLDAYGVEVIGANAEAIATAEDRERFKAAMEEIGLAVPASGFAHSLDEALAIGESIGYPDHGPAQLHPGRGGHRHRRRPRRTWSAWPPRGSTPRPVSEVLIEQSIAGQKEFELEVMRDDADNCVVICSIENLDPMGVHTGDSITVAPAQTLTDVEYQEMRDAAFACIRRVGVETGGSNVQFAVDPADGRQVVIEMNPRVSRSSALASKATGFPIAKIAARLAVGYRLDEITNDITGATPASFEPTIDYVVTKIPRWAFEKLPGATDRLGTRMQSVGEVMGIGRTFPESLQKAVRSLEQGRSRPQRRPGRGGRRAACPPTSCWSAVAAATPERIFQLEALLRRGVSVDRLAAATGIDPWFLSADGRDHRRPDGPRPAGDPGGHRRRPRPPGVAPAQAAGLLRRSSWPTCSADAVTADDIRAARTALGVGVTFKTVDTCGAEFEAHTPYHYSTTEDEDEVRPSDRPRVVILGSGPNRIGQGIEFDYCCVHASFALRAAGYETVMVNCNPETVSTDYDTSDRLYFEPLTPEDLANVLERRAGRLGRGGPAGRGHRQPGRPDPAQAGRRHPRRAGARDLAGLDRPGRGPRAVERPVRPAGHPPAPGGHGHHGGRGGGGGRGRSATRCWSGPPTCSAAGPWRSSTTTSGWWRRSRPCPGSGGSLGREGGVTADRPVLVDRFLEDAVEVDVDAVRDATGEVVICGVMEHVEEAGVHSGDSACALPPQTLSPARWSPSSSGTSGPSPRPSRSAGLINVQFAVKDDRAYVLEANPRASRTVPFVAKATGVPVAMVAARVMVGATLAELRQEGLL